MPLLVQLYGVCVYDMEINFLTSYICFKFEPGKWFTLLVSNKLDLEVILREELIKLINILTDIMCNISIII